MIWISRGIYTKSFFGARGVLRFFSILRMHFFGPKNGSPDCAIALVRFRAPGRHAETPRLAGALAMGLEGGIWILQFAHDFRFILVTDAMDLEI
jgi:hypothetical protein